MLYILKNEQKQANWQEGYEKTYEYQLSKNAIEYRIMFSQRAVDRKILSTLKPSDHLWVMHYKDLLLPEVKRTKAQVLFRISGTSRHPYCYQVNAEEEDYVIKEVVDINMVFSSRMKDYMENEYPGERFEDTGYPVFVDKTYESIQVPKSIAVGGRITPDKQFYLATFLLEGMVKEGYTVTFCYPNNNGKDQQWLDTMYDRKRFERKGFRFKNLTKEEWLKEVAESEFCFTCSLGDISNNSMIEGAELDSYPVAPNIRFSHGLPCYMDYLSKGYEAFSRDSVEEMIIKKPNIVVSDGWYNPDDWARRFIHQVLK